MGRIGLLQKYKIKLRRHQFYLALSVRKMKFICPSNEYLFGKINEFTNGMKDVFRRGKKSLEHFSWEHIVNFISFS